MVDNHHRFKAIYVSVLEKSVRARCIMDSFTGRRAHACKASVFSKDRFQKALAVYLYMISMAPQNSSIDGMTSSLV